MYSNHVLIAIVIYRYDIIAINRTEVVDFLIELELTLSYCVYFVDREITKLRVEFGNTAVKKVTKRAECMKSIIYCSTFHFS